MLTSTNNYELRITITDEAVKQILRNTPRGIKKAFVEKAIFEFAKKAPKVDLFYEGITRKRKTRKIPILSLDSDKERSNTNG